MSKEFPEMDRVRLTVDETTRQRHLGSINSAIRATTAPRPRRLRFLAVGIAILLLLPVIALASEGSVPGDFLYPVKRAVEPIVEVFDVDVAAERRVEEVEILLDRQAPTDVIHSHIDEAREAVTDHWSELSDRIDVVVAELDRREPQVDGPTERTGDQVSDEPPTRGNDQVSTDNSNEIDSGDAAQRDVTTTTVETTDATQGRDRGGDG
ncbi:MAG: hypothetical protein ACC658_08090 [Acidimicrobiia bacterium]